MQQRPVCCSGLQAKQCILAPVLGGIDILGIGLAPFAGESSSIVVVISLAFNPDECEDSRIFDLTFLDPDLKLIFGESSFEFNIAPNPEDGSCGLMWHSLPIVEWPTSGVYTAEVALNGMPLCEILTHAHRKPRTNSCG